jgi:hypothetical protein
MREVTDLLPNLEADLDTAWQLAYVMVADESAAATAAKQAFVHTVSSESVDEADRLHLLATTLKLTADATVDGPEVDRPLVSAFWRLPGQQRAALWLSAVERLSNAEIGEVLGVSPEDANQAAARAEDWLEVAAERTSGPLCAQEPSLPDYLKGALPARAAARMTKHIRTCPTCRSRVEAFEELLDLKDVLRNALPDPPESLTAGALDDWGQASAAAVVDRESSRAPLPPQVRWLAACAGALLILGLIGIGVVHRATASSGTAPSTPGASVTTTLPSAGPATTSVPVNGTTNLPPVTFPSAPSH